MNDNEYKCDSCGNVYEKGRSDEEAEKEADSLWGEIPKEERVIICDDCFNKMHPEKNKELARKHGYKK